MQEKNHADVKKILLAIAEHLGVRGIRGLAVALGEKESKLYAWINRGSIGDVGAILKRCPGIRVDWLQTGDGDMFVPAYPHGTEKFKRFARALENNREGVAEQRSSFGAGPPGLTSIENKLLLAFRGLTPQQQEDKLFEIETLAERNESRRNAGGGSSSAGGNSA